MSYEPRVDKELLLKSMPAKHEIVSVEHPYVEANRTTLVEWTLGNTCNFSCSYCPDELHNGSDGWIDIQQVKKFIGRLHTFYHDEMQRDLWLQYTGGEPTLYPHILDLLQYAYDLGIKQSLISNGSKTLKFWQQAHSFIETIHLTFHAERADQDYFLKVVDFLYGKCNIHINFTMIPDQFDEIFAYAETIRRSFDRLTMSLKPLRVNFGKDLYDYSPEQLEKIRVGLPSPQKIRDNFCRSFMVLAREDGRWFYEKANPLIVKQYNTWEGWDCRAGVESLVVWSDGSIKKSMCGVDGVIGKITDEELNLPKDGTTCPHDRCRCVSDILISKRKPL